MSDQRNILAEASAWLAQLHGPQRSEGMEADFRGWLAADRRHAEAFESVTSVWDALGSVNVGGLPRLATRDPFVPRRVGLRVGFAALAACVIAAIGAYLFFSASVYSTGVGEQRTVTLADGSRISLNSATRVEVHFSKQGRSLAIRRGEALFEVARDSSRPFTVAAGDRIVTALGTSFVVKRLSDRVDVTLIEGKVSVVSTADAHRNPREAVVLVPGERLTLMTDRVEKIEVARTDVVAAWRSGEVVLNEMPLSEAIEEMNRYDHKALVLDRDSIGKLPVSGIYRAGNNLDFARAMAAMYGLKITEEEDEIRLTGR